MVKLSSKKELRQLLWIAFNIGVACGQGEIEVDGRTDDFVQAVRDTYEEMRKREKLLDPVLFRLSLMPIAEKALAENGVGKYTPRGRR